MSAHTLEFLRDYSTGIPVPYENHQEEPEPSGSQDGNNPNPASNPDSVAAVTKKARRRKPRDKPPKRETQREAARRLRVQNRSVVQEKCKSCYFACPTKISDEQRTKINEQYWAMKYSEQRAYVKAHTVQGKVKRRRVKGDPLGDEPPDLKRAFTYKFYLPDEGGELAAVCCAFFLGTLGYKNKSSTLIYRAHLPEKVVDRSGKRGRPLYDAVWEDVLSYAPRTYHKGENFGPTALYLPTALTIKMMHTDFKIKQEKKGGKPCSYGFYTMVLKEMDVHFVEMDDFEIGERPEPLPQEVTKVEESADELKESYEPPAMDQPQPNYNPVEYKPNLEHYTAYQAIPQSFYVQPVKQEPLPEVVDYSNEEQNVSYSEEYLDQYSESSYEEATNDSQVMVEEPKVEIIHEEYLEPYPLEPQTSQSTVPDPEPKTDTVKRKKRPAEPGPLPEGYPPVKYPKRFIKRIANKEIRRKSHQVLRTDCKCMFDCNKKITHERRECINEEYWSSGFCDQRMFVLAHTERHSIKRRRSKSEEKRKDFTYSYRLLDSAGTYHQVCAHFFLNTIGYEAKSSSIIYRAHQLDLADAIYDRRGKFREQTPREINLRESVDGDILSYFSQEQIEAGGPLDLSGTDWFPKKMYAEYLRKQEELGSEKPASLSYYYQRTKDLKIVFAPKPEAKPKKRSKAEYFPGFNGVP